MDTSMSKDKLFPMHFDYCVSKLCEISLKVLNDFDGDVQLFIVQAAPVFLQYNYCVRKATVVVLKENWGCLNNE